MRSSLFISTVLLILSLSTPTYAQSFSIPNEYRGDPLIQSEELFLGLEENCLNYNENGEYKASERDSCPLDHFSFDFASVYGAIGSKTAVIHGDGYQLTLEEKSIDYYFNNNEYAGSELLLSLVEDRKVKDSLSLGSRYSNESSYASVGNQYYYLSDQGDIYVLQVLTVEEGDSPLLWKHYRVDGEKQQFRLQKMLIDRIGILYQVTYPDQVEISRPLTPYVHDTLKAPEEFNLCLHESNNSYCVVDAYMYYSNQLKENNSISEYSEIEKEINSFCLKKQPPSHFNEIDGYNGSLLSCLIEQTQQKLNPVSD